MRVLIAAVVLLGLTQAGVSVQSLGEVAQREEARRQSIVTPARLYTNASLKAEQAPAWPNGSSPASPWRVPASSQPAPASQARGEAQSLRVPDSAPAGGAGDESAWQARVTAVRAALTRAETLRDALQSRVNALDTDFVNRDDPVQRSRIAIDRQSALAELDRVTSEIDRNRTAIEEIQEEARRAGVPPGWLR
jgi:hypothetical protein